MRPFGKALILTAFVVFAFVAHTASAQINNALSTEVACGGLLNTCPVTCPHWSGFDLIIGSKAATPTQIADCAGIENDGSVRITCNGDITVPPTTFFSGDPIATFGSGNCCTLRNTSVFGSCSLSIECAGCIFSDAAFVHVTW